VPTIAQPLVVDWKSNDQLELAVAMQKNLAVVAYDCKTIRLLNDCSIKGHYGFTAVPSLLQETVKIDDADEAKASLPLGGAQLGGEIARGATIDIALAYVGKNNALNEKITKDDLVGSECSQATHYVRGATIGAFAMVTGTKGDAAAAAQIFGAGASGSSSSAKSRLNSGGDVAACKVSGASDKPPEGCSAIVRLDLTAIDGVVPKDDGKSGPPPLENTCPEGFAPGGGICQKKTGTEAYRCDPTNLDECKAQCDKGNTDSCYNAGVILQKKVTSNLTEALDTNKLAAPFFEKACEASVAGACSRLAVIYLMDPRFGDHEAQAVKYFKKGCDLLEGSACWNAAGFDSTMSFEERLNFRQRGCKLGVWRSCEEVAQAELEADPARRKADWGPPRTQDALALLDAWCDSKAPWACGDLGTLYTSGKMSMVRATEVKPDAAKAAQYIIKYCAAGKNAFGAFDCSQPADKVAAAAIAKAKAPADADAPQPGAADKGKKPTSAFREGQKWIGKVTCDGKDTDTTLFIGKAEGAFVRGELQVEKKTTTPNGGWSLNLSAFYVSGRATNGRLGLTPGNSLTHPDPEHPAFGMSGQVTKSVFKGKVNGKGCTRFSLSLQP
jgi:TPR repeat protein